MKVRFPLTSRCRARFGLAALLLPLATRAQTPGGELRGVVRTREGPPVAGVQLQLRPGGRAAQSDSAGRFELTGLPGGVYMVSLRRTGFASDSAEVAIGRDEVVTKDFALERQTELAPVAVTEVSALSLDMSDIESRRKEGIGDFISRADLAAREGSKLIDVLRSRTTRFKMVRFCGQVAFASTMGSMVSLMPTPPQRNGGCGAPRECYAQFFVNGIRLYASGWAGLPPNLDQYAPNQIEAIEVYHGSASTPLRYGGTGATCGTIAIWLRRQ